ncbi:hypothetical protein D3C84_929170 [compost metagenome]
MRHDMGIDPQPGGRVSERNAIMEAQLEDAGQPLNQQRELNFHLTHRHVCAQRLKTFPNHSLTIKPEWRLRQAALELHQ